MLIFTSESLQILSQLYFKDVCVRRRGAWGGVTALCFNLFRTPAE